jgi:hypothetical protein
MRLTTAFEWGRWLGLAKLIWGLAREKGVTITWFRRTYPWIVRERIDLRLEAEPVALIKFYRSVHAGMGGDY